MQTVIADGMISFIAATRHHNTAEQLSKTSI